MLPIPMFRRARRRRVAAGASVTFDAASTSASSSSEASRTWSHTCTGTDLKLFVAVARHGSGSVGEGGGDVPTVTGVTYNGVALTSTTTVFDDSEFAYLGIDMWYLDAPATGAHDVVVSVSPDCTMACGAVSFTGAAPGEPTLTGGGAQAAFAEEWDNTAEGVLTGAYGLVAALGASPATSITAAGECVERVDNDGDALGVVCWMGTVTGVDGEGEFNEVHVGATFEASAYAAFCAVVEPAS